MGTLKDRRSAQFDGLYAEAKQLLSQSANELKAVTERLRQSHAEEMALAAGRAGTPSGVRPDASADSERRDREARMARQAGLLGRLEVASRELEQSWRFLERGSGGSWTDGQRPGADDPELDVPSRGAAAMQLLEAREQERATVAAELHDGPAQAMANAIFQVDIIDRTLRNDPAAGRIELLALRGELDRELERLRGFIHQLHPTLQGDDDLDEAIRELARGMDRDSGIEVELKLGAPVEMLDASRVRAVLRVAQEALRNVRKHASASRVLLSTFLEPDMGGPGGPRWILEIADNGRGFPVDDVLGQTSKRHFGLRFMRERAQLIGARLEIVSNPAVGTTIRLALEPVKRS
jgi:two-component system sensor histidine kinase DegS